MELITMVEAARKGRELIDRPVAGRMLRIDDEGQRCACFLGMVALGYGYTTKELIGRAYLPALAPVRLIKVDNYITKVQDLYSCEYRTTLDGRTRFNGNASIMSDWDNTLNFDGVCERVRAVEDKLVNFRKSLDESPAYRRL